ncbi:MAG: hypothetical protein AAGA66_03320 [Bacteroidota bacterium]
MDEILTISRETPSVQSMDYGFLKDEGIRRIQELAGKIWTDYNEQDPGVTFLEALCYALTDLGYRTTFDMKDLLAPNPNDGTSDGYDFYTARQILHNNPVTIQDYRKLLMDVSLVIDPDGNVITDTSVCSFDPLCDPASGSGQVCCEIIGIKNAWLEIATDSEHTVYPDTAESRLSYIQPEITEPAPLDLKVLYDIVLEFSDSRFLEDLNQDTTEFDFPIFHPDVVALIGDPTISPDPSLYEYDKELFDTIKGLYFLEDGSRNEENIKNVQEQTLGLTDVQVKVNVEFPRWDEVDLNWNDIGEIKRAIKDIRITFIGLPDDMVIIYKLDDDTNDILLASGREELKDRAVPFLADITNRVNCLVLGPSDSMLKRYQNKVLAILALLDKARARLNAHRNICEDFFRFSALRVEDVLVCADVELDANANVSEVEGTIFYLLDRFLAPTVNFYSLEEILEKDLEDKKYEIRSINRDSNTITLPSVLNQELLPGDTVSLSGFGEEVIEYTVQSVSPNALNERFTDISVAEEITSATESEGSFLFAGRLSEEKTRLTEEVFEGPALESGFIDTDELETADRVRFVRASDIMNLIMDVGGVVAVRTLQIANSPQDENPDITRRSVKWCLELAVDQNYVPRLSREGSSLTFYKDELPFTASVLASDETFEALKAAERNPKPPNPKLDFDIPRGEYRQLSDYTSIQDDLPATYGVGPEGIPTDLRDQEEIRQRKLKIKQLKGFLMIFDQLLANYLEQLDHVKHLFSFNPLRKDANEESGELPAEYNFQIDKTYFSQPIHQLVSNALELYFSLFDDQGDSLVDKDGLSEKGIRNLLAKELQPITEDLTTFQKRRNKFLDHLLGRFSEQFTDYALLAYRLNEPKTELELIEDKQDFLSRYPNISANRGKAFDYKSSLFWYLDNSSGLEKRASFLTGIDPLEPEQLVFDPRRIKIAVESGGKYFFEVVKVIEDPSDGSETTTRLLQSMPVYSSKREVAHATEKAILYGVVEENYNIRCHTNDNNEQKYVTYLTVEGKDVAFSFTLYDSEDEARTGIPELIEIFEKEFFENPLSNRKNMTLPFNNYFTETVDNIDTVTETYQINYELYASPYGFEDENASFLLSGSLPDVPYMNDETVDPKALRKEIEEDVKDRIRTTYWDIVYYGGRLCLYAENGTDLQVIDKVGDPVARGDISTINGLLPAGENEEGLSDYKKAVERLTTFFEQTFFRQEGLHLLEHVLLRPKVNNVWVAADIDDVKLLPEQEVFIPVKERLTDEAKEQDGQLVFDGDYRDQVPFNAEVTLTPGAGEVQDGGPKQVTIVKGIAYDSTTNETGLTLNPPISSDFDALSMLKLEIKRMVQVVEIQDSDPGALPVLDLIESTDPNLFVDGMTVRLTDLRDQANYGEFRIMKRVSDSDDASTGPGIQLTERKLQDRLLPIYIPNADNNIGDPTTSAGCDDCQMENPYSFIAQVAVAGWPGRFDNIDFRDFFERTLQLESPAHVFLNTCWIGYDQMELFERRYKKWVLANLKEDDPEAMSKAQNELVEILYELRNVYPVKTLHDCEDDEGTEGAIILNQTALGEI